MATFPRTIPPYTSTLPAIPPALKSVGLTGKVQTRATTSIGRVWTETWSVLSASASNVQALVAFIETHFHQGTVLDVIHYQLPGSGKAPNGAGGGTPLVNGASQTGASLVTDGWSNSITGVVYSGDVFRVAGLNQTFRSTSTVNSTSSGAATLTINPPIAAGGSPANNAALTRASCVVRAVIDSYDLPSCPPDQYFSGLSVTFREAV